MNFPTQLEMVWPERRRNALPDCEPPDGYFIRAFLEGDNPAFFELMELAGWADWSEERLRPWVDRMLSEGWFMLVHKQSNQIVATAMALRSEAFDGGGELGWLAVLPSHRGKGLGRVLCAAVTRRFLTEGCWPIHLYTEDFRLPALRTYLALGYVPVLTELDSANRWKSVCKAVNWNCDPSG